MSRKHNVPRDAEESAVPLFGTWWNAYVTVVVAFVVEVGLFYIVTRMFS